MIEGLDEYQGLTTLTLNKELDVHEAIKMCAMGVASEAGEINEQLKKHYYHGHQLDVDNIVEEIGDSLWYLAQLSAAFGFDLSYVASANIAKLKRRYPQGFQSSDSINRTS